MDTPRIGAALDLCRALPWAAAVSLATLAGCAADPGPDRVVHDLVGDLAAAEVAWEPGVYDLGTPAARPALVDGWGRNESAGGRSWVWSLGEGAELELFVAAPRDLLLELTLQPFTAAGLPLQRLKLAAETAGERRPLGALELRPGVHEYRLSVPAAALRPGPNRIFVSHAWSRPPAEVSDSRDRRPLAAAWYRLRVLEADGTSLHAAAGENDQATPGPPPRPTREGRLHLPAGSRVDFHLALPAGSRMVADRVRVRDGAILEVGLRRRGGEPGWLLRDAGAAEGLDLPLAEDAGLARLRLRVPPGPGGVTLERPRVAVGGRRAGDDAAAATRGETPAAAEMAPGAVHGEAPGPRPDLVLYVIDTLRADALGAYGSRTGATPRLDAFAAEALLFERARAQSPWTQPSVASLFTGLWPAGHGVVSGQTRLPGDLPSLPELLRDAGYRTAAAVANGYVSRDFGFDRGFDSFRMLPDLHTRAGAVQEAALAWLDQTAGDDRPFFLYLHTIDPHAPYDPPPATAERFAPGIDPGLGTVERMAELASGLVTPSAGARAELAADLGALYTGDVAWQDREIGRFFDELTERGLYDGAALLVLSDHGEEFGEHGDWTHGLNLHRESLDVPLLLRLPGGQAGGTRVAAAAQHVDIPGTLLRLAGVDPAAALAPAAGEASRGGDLVRLARAARDGDAPPPVPSALPADLPGRPVFSHLDRFHTAGASVERGRWKVILPLSPALGRQPRLYDRRADPGETRDLAASHPVLTGWLAAAVRRELAAARHRATHRPPPPPAEMDEETRQGLRALGYLR